MGNYHAELGRQVFQGPLRTLYIDTRQHTCIYAVEVEAKVSRRTKETREGEKRKEGGVGNEKIILGSKIFF